MLSRPFLQAFQALSRIQVALGDEIKLNLVKIRSHIHANVLEGSQFGFTVPTFDIINVKESD